MALSLCLIIHVLALSIILRCTHSSNEALDAIYLNIHVFNLSNKKEWSTKKNRNNETISCTLDIPLLCVYHTNIIQTDGILILFYDDSIYDFANNSHWNRINIIKHIWFDNNNEDKLRRRLFLGSLRRGARALKRSFLRGVKNKIRRWTRRGPQRRCRCRRRRRCRCKRRRCKSRRCRRRGMMGNMYPMMNSMMNSMMNPMMNPMMSGQMMGGMGGMGMNRMGMNGMGMSHPMMSGQMMGMNGMNGMGMSHPMMSGQMNGMNGMGMDGNSMGKYTEPEININAEVEKKKKKRKNENERRLIEIFDAEVDNGYVIEKCVMDEEDANNNNIGICLVYNYYDGDVFLKYIVGDNEKDGYYGYIERDEWILSDINVEGREMEQCQDEMLLLMGYDKICVFQLGINGDISILIKKQDDDKVDNMEFSLMDDGNWNNIYYINNNTKRFCRYMFNVNKLCIQVTFDRKSSVIKKVNKISIQKNIISRYP